LPNTAQNTADRRQEIDNWKVEAATPGSNQTHSLKSHHLKMSKMNRKAGKQTEQ